MSSDLALVLSGGGARAAYQVGVLSALGELAPALRLPVITGVSAGAINTVCLAAHPGSLRDGVETLEHHWRRLTSERVYCVRPVRMARGLGRLVRHTITGRARGDVAVHGLLSMDPLRGFLEEVVDLGGIGANIRAGTLRAAALSATSYTTGWTVTFTECASGVPMWTRAQRMALRTHVRQEHVLASSAIPLIFPAVRINKEYFGDGSLRQSAPLAPAIHLGARRIFAISMRAKRSATIPALGQPDYPSSAEVFGLLFHSVFLDSLDVDAERLERVNQMIRSLPAGAAPPEGMSLIRLLVMRPSRDLGQMARGYEVELPRSLSFLARAMGARRERASDFLSYLMFNPAYTGDLIDLGYADTRARRAEIEAFLE